MTSGSSEASARVCPAGEERLPQRLYPRDPADVSEGVRQLFRVVEHLDDPVLGT